MKSIIKPLTPSDLLWRPVAMPPQVTMGYAGMGWMHPCGLFAISAVEVAVDKDGIDRGPEYHISISKHGGRCSSEEARWVLREFGLEGAEEDNHVPHGVVRNFWRPVAENLIGMECACKKEEVAVREDKGDYVWRP